MLGEQTTLRFLALVHCSVGASAQKAPMPVSAEQLILSSAEQLILSTAQRSTA